jgi:hypothetical protein
VLIQHFAYRRSSRRRKGAARHIIDMVWLYRSPIPVGRRVVLFTSSNDFSAFAAPRGRGGEVSTLCILQFFFTCVYLRKGMG